MLHLNLRAMAIFIGNKSQRKRMQSKMNQLMSQLKSQKEELKSIKKLQKQEKYLNKN